MGEAVKSLPRLLKRSSLGVLRVLLACGGAVFHFLPQGLPVLFRHRRARAAFESFDDLRFERGKSNLPFLIVWCIWISGDMIFRLQPKPAYTLT